MKKLFVPALSYILNGQQQLDLLTLLDGYTISFDYTPVGVYTVRF